MSSNPFYLTIRIDGQKYYRADWGGWTRRRDQAQRYVTTIEAGRDRVLAVRVEDEEGEEPDGLRPELMEVVNAGRIESPAAGHVRSESGQVDAGHS